MNFPPYGRPPAPPGGPRTPRMPRVLRRAPSEKASEQPPTQALGLEPGKRSECPQRANYSSLSTPHVAKLVVFEELMRLPARPCIRQPAVLRAYLPVPPGEPPYRIHLRYLGVPLGLSPARSIFEDPVRDVLSRNELRTSMPPLAKVDRVPSRIVPGTNPEQEGSLPVHRRAHHAGGARAA